MSKSFRGCLAPLFVYMLHPLYRQRLSRSNDQLIPASEEITEGMEHHVIGYSQFQDYTLVTWEYGNSDNSFVGETLYRGLVAIASGGGRLPIYEIPTSTPEISKMFRPWEMGGEKPLDPAIGRYGLPANVAFELRNPRRIRRF